MVWKAVNYGLMSEKQRQQLISEVNILRELRHENIVRYHDKVLDKRNTTLYIIMEYCAGGDLGQVIRRSRDQGESLSEERIWAVLMQIVLALFECHRRKDKKVIILHRDLKPSNIFLDDKQNIKLGDFGFAKSIDSTTEYAQTNLGTPHYMSPEQLESGTGFSEKSDIWALGCIVYEMAALH
jgi:NIMA (never in mitosis gene a)-related kinase